MIQVPGHGYYYYTVVAPNDWTASWLMTDDIEKEDADIIPDETPPLPPDEPVKTDPIPEEAP